MRHHGGPDDRDGQAQLVTAAEVRDDAGGELPVVLITGHEEDIEEADADEHKQGDDCQFESAVAALLEGQDHKCDGRSDQPGRQ